jgi:hypothetical protein
MKAGRLLLLAVALAAFPALASATSHWSDIDGTLTSTAGATGYKLSNVGQASSITGVTGAGAYDCAWGGTTALACGKVSYTTGLTAGLNPSLINNIGTGPTSLGNGTLTIAMNNGANGFPVGSGPGGVVFTGTFTNITWSYIGTCTSTACTGGGYWQWMISGNVSGTYYLPSGQAIQVSGFNVQLTTQRFKSTSGPDPFANGTGHLSGGPGGVTLGGTVPEQGTLILFGTGLVGVALVARKKLTSSLRV